MRAYVLLLLISAPVFADEPKAEAAAKPPEAKPDSKAEAKPEPMPATVWKANVQAGVSYIAGNAESLGFTGNGVANVKHYNNQAEFFAQGAYTWVGIRDLMGGPVVGHKAAALNWLGRARYDRYFAEKNTLFASFTISGDRFAGFTYRIEPQLGYSRILHKSDRLLLRTELGYDYNFDHYVAGTVPDSSDFHSVRGFFFGEYKFNQQVALSDGLEVLWALNHVSRARVNNLLTLSAAVSTRVSVKLNWTLKSNFDPPPLPAPLTGQYGVLDSTLDAALAVSIL